MKICRRNLILGASAFLLTSGNSAFASQIDLIEGPAFGASWRVIVPSGTNVTSIKMALESVINSVNTSMSPYLDNSEISRFNHSQSTGWQKIPLSVCNVVETSISISKHTKGAFDPTLGGLVGQYGFGPIRQRSRGNISDISVGDGMIKKAHGSITLDLCGIAKGFALDRMVQVLEQQGILDFFIELGGEIHARGLHPSNRPWYAGIEAPEGDGLAVQRIVRMNNEAMATSGDRANGYDHNKRRYSHIIDPGTLEPANHQLASVSVFAKTGILADGWATALFAMGPIAGPQLAVKDNISALFLVRNDGGHDEIMTGYFKDRILTQEPR